MCHTPRTIAANSTGRERGVVSPGAVARGGLSPDPEARARQLAILEAGRAEARARREKGLPTKRTEAKAGESRGRTKESSGATGKGRSSSSGQSRVKAGDYGTGEVKRGRQKKRTRERSGGGTEAGEQKAPRWARRLAPIFGIRVPTD